MEKYKHRRRSATHLFEFSIVFDGVIRALIAQRYDCIFRVELLTFSKAHNTFSALSIEFCFCCEFCKLIFKFYIRQSLTWVRNIEDYCSFEDFEWKFKSTQNFHSIRWRHSFVGAGAQYKCTEWIYLKLLKARLDDMEMLKNCLRYATFEPYTDFS